MYLGPGSTAKRLSRLLDLAVLGLEALLPVRDRAAGLLLEMLDVIEDTTHLPLGHVAFLVLVKEFPDGGGVLLAQRLVGLGQVALGFLNAVLRRLILTAERHLDFVRIDIVLHRRLGQCQAAFPNRRRRAPTFSRSQ